MEYGIKFGTLWETEQNSEHYGKWNLLQFQFFRTFLSFPYHHFYVTTVLSSMSNRRQQNQWQLSLSFFPSLAKHRISNLAEQKIFYIDFQFFSLFVTSKVNISSTRSLIFSNFQGERSEEEKSVHVDCENIWRKAISVSVYTQKK